MLETRSITALGHTNRQWTDAAGRTLRSFDALDKATVYTYDAAGNQLTVRDPNSVGEDIVYDALGRAGLRTDTASDTSNSGYDKAGNRITATDGKSETTTYTYDARNRQIKPTDRLGGETEFAYTASGQLASLTDAEDQVTSYSYDNAGNKLTETHPDHINGSTVGQTGHGIVSFNYDPAGRVDVRTDQQGDTCTYGYDLAGRLTSRAYTGMTGGPLSGQSYSDTFTYDAASRMLTAVSGGYSNTVTYTYDDAGRKDSEAFTMGGQTYTTGLDYDASGQLVEYTYPDGTTVGRSYTDRGQLYQLSYDSTTIDTRAYDDGGRMTSSTYNNGVAISRSYNNDNTLASISFTGSAIGTYSYTWDDNKNKTSESITGVMSNYGFTVGTSGYDEEDRLVNWERSDSNLDQAWNLSLVGDWNSFTENSSTQNRTHGPTHELLAVGGSSLTHDTKGNMTLIPAVLRPDSNDLALKWDFENKMTTADVGNDSTVDVTYKWDALGRRVYRDDGSSAVIYVQVGQQTIADYGYSMSPTSPMYNYVYVSYIDEPVLRDKPSASELLYFHRNQQYGISSLTNAVGNIVERYAYDAYGKHTVLDSSGMSTLTSIADNRYTHTGREYDEAISLIHYRARMCDAGSGRFCTRDPIGFGGGKNFYMNYFDVRMSDPSGLKACSNVKFGFDSNVFHSPHHHGSGPHTSEKHFNFNFFKKVLPCEFDIRPYGMCKYKKCQTCCPNKIMGETGEGGCNGGGNGLIKCHTEGLAWIEFGGKLGIEATVTRKWDTCEGTDSTSLCMGVTGGVFGSGCVGFRLLGTRACISIKFDCSGGFCMDLGSEPYSGYGSCKLSVTGDACAFGMCAAGEFGYIEYNFATGQFGGGTITW